MRKEYDEVRLRSTRQRKILEELKDMVRTLELDSQRPHMEVLSYQNSIALVYSLFEKYPYICYFAFRIMSILGLFEL